MKDDNHDIEVKYKKSFIVFLDVLGFSNKTMSANSEEELSSYFSMVNSYIIGLSETLKKSSDETFTLNHLVVSDSIIFTVELVGQADLLFLFQQFVIAIQSLQGALAASNIWVRGGITCGDVFINLEKGLIAGPGLISAYKIEDEIARYPRIVIDPKIMEVLGAKDSATFIKEVNGGSKEDGYQNGDKKICNSLIFDWNILQRVESPLARDVHFFLDTGGFLINSLFDREVNVLNQVVAHLLNALYKEVNHFEKYHWLKVYFSTCLAYKISLGGASERVQLLAEKLRNN